MAKYNATKALCAAVPTIRTEDNIVKSWDLSIMFSYNGFNREYSHNANVLYMQKKADEFTKSDLMALCNVAQMEQIFDAHYEATTAQPVEQRLGDFDITKIPD